METMHGGWGDGIVTRVDRTKGIGWLKAKEGERGIERFFRAADLKGGLCISKLRKGTAVFFEPWQEGNSMKARNIRPIGVTVIDKGEEDA